MYYGYCEFIKNGQFSCMKWDKNSILRFDLSKESGISEITYFKKIENSNNAKLINFKQ